MRLFIWIGVSVVVVAGIAWGAYAWFGKGSAAAQDKGAAVRIEEVFRGDLVEVVQAPGEIQPYNKVSISAKVTARITEIPVVEGQQVKAGDVLVRLDSRDMEALLKSAEARYAAQKAAILVAESRVAAQESNLVGTRATLADAERQLQRECELLGSKIVAQASVDEAQRRVDEVKASLEAGVHGLKADQTNLQVLRHNLEAAEAEISRAQEDLSYSIIASPLDGIVTLVNAKVGELVVTGTMNNAGTVIMEVADLSKMLVLARVDEADVTQVKVDQPVKVRVQAYPDRIFEGVVTSVALVRASERDRSLGNSPMTSGKSFKTEVLLKTDGNERIYSGLTAETEIETKRHQGVLKVPSQAVLARRIDDLPTVIRDNNPHIERAKTFTTVVYRFVDGKAVVTPVSVGPSDLTHTYIKAGLNENERVIVGPFKVLENLAHDQKVHDERESTTQPASQPATAAVAATATATATAPTTQAAH